MGSPVPIRCRTHTLNVSKDVDLGADCHYVPSPMFYCICMENRLSWTGKSPSKSEKYIYGSVLNHHVISMGANCKNFRLKSDKLTFLDTDTCDQFVSLFTICQKFATGKSKFAAQKIILSKAGQLPLMKC